MQKVFFTTALILAAHATPLVAQELSAGSRVLIQVEDREDYSPKIVNCNAESGLCLRDTRTSPANKPIMKTKNGMQVNFPTWGIIYVFGEGGKGTVFDSDGKKLGPFSWTQ